MHNLVLFDIDGTLVLTGKAGLRAMTRAIERVLGRGGGLADIPVAGRTDWSILTDAVQRFGRQLDGELLGELRDLYVELLREEIQHPGEGTKAVLPGVRELLEELQTRQDVSLGLLTGNFAASARIKLEHFDLWKYFRCGAFGDDAADRNALVPFAVRRAREVGVPEVQAGRVLVVGDTPHDIACAQAAGAMPIGVATGGYSVADLRACGADVVLEDLSDRRAFCALL